MSTALRTWITAFQLCCLDDGMQESPHGIITGFANRKKRSLPRHWAALFRHAQNMDLKRSLDMNHPGRFSALFRYYRLLFSKKPTYGSQTLVHPRQLPRAKFGERVYRMNDFSFYQFGSVKKEQAKFLLSVTDETQTISSQGKIFREYLRMVLLPKDIVSIMPEVVPVAPADKDGANSEAEPEPMGEPPELFSIISSDQTRLKTIVTQSSVADLSAPAPFMVLYVHE